ncbi:hypothetical protein ACHAXM_011649 [Skeletonema potamos]
MASNNESTHEEESVPKVAGEGGAAAAEPEQQPAKLASSTAPPPSNVDADATNNQGQTFAQNDEATSNIIIPSQPGVMFVPGPDFRGGIHTGYHSAHESDEDEAHANNVIADTFLVEGTLVPEEPVLQTYEATLVPDIPTYEATLVPEGDSEGQTNDAQVKRYQITLIIILCGFAAVVVALAIGLPLGLRKSTNNDGSSLGPTSSAFPSLSPTSSSRPSLRPSSHPSLSPTITPFFKQKGHSKNGNAQMDLFGGTFSLSTDGSTLAVAAPQLGPMPNRSGYVLIMKWNEILSDYVQLGDPMVGDNHGDGLGYTLALSGDASKLAVGTPYHDTNGDSSGHVKIYLWNEAALNYTHTGDIFYGTKAGDLLGDTLQMSADAMTLVIGASSSDTNSEDAGEVRVYRWDEADSSFKLNGTLFGAKNDRFGYSLSISPDDGVIAVGAIGSPTTPTDTLGYKQQGSPIYGNAPSDKFGWSCSLSNGGKYLAIGALLDASGGGSFDDSSITTADQVKVYEWDGTKYMQVGDALDGDRNKDDFGASISISGDGKILAVGAPENDSNGAQSGQVKLFKLNDSGLNYTPFGEPLLGERASNYFGGPVAIAGDSKSFAVGAVGNSEEGDFSGQLQIFLIPPS